MIRHCRALLRNARGSVAIETALVTPVLVLLMIGVFEASRLVSRQLELQSAAAEASQIALASAPKNATERATLEGIIETSADLDADEVAIVEKFRCGTDAALVDSSTACGTTPYAAFVQITLTDTLSPIWKEIAFGSDVDYNVVRTVQVG